MNRDSESEGTETAPTSSTATSPHKDIEFLPTPGASTVTAQSDGPSSKMVSDEQHQEGQQQPTTMIPRRGSYNMDRRSSRTSNQFQQQQQQQPPPHPMEINFSPGGSSMTTAEVPKKGSFVGDKEVEGVSDEGAADNNNSHSSPEVTPHPTTSLRSYYNSTTETIKEVNFSPAAGHDMVTTGAPSQGSFVLKRKNENTATNATKKKPIDEEYVEELLLQDTDHERWKTQKSQIKLQQEYIRDACKPTPKTSNKRSVAVRGIGQDNKQLSAVHEMFTTSGGLPILQNPLHDNDNDDINEDDDDDGSNNAFTGDNSSGEDITPVLPCRHPSDGSFQSTGSSGKMKKKAILQETTTSKIRALEREAHFVDDDDYDDDDDDDDDVFHGDHEIISRSSSFVGDVDERQGRRQNNPQPRDIQFSPEGYLLVETLDAPKQGSFLTGRLSSTDSEDNAAVVVGTKTATKKASTGTVPEREINFSPGASDMNDVAVPKVGSFRGNIDVFDDIKDDVLTTDAAATENLDDKASHLISETQLSDSHIPGESFLKMGAVLQSQHDVPEQFDTIVGKNTKEESTGEYNGDDRKRTPDRPDKDFPTREDDVLEAILGNAFGEKDESAATEIVGSAKMKDEHDDLLDSVLGDAKDDVASNVSNGSHRDELLDPDDDLLDRMLGDADEAAVVMQNGNQTSSSAEIAEDTYVPDESIRKLEALLDEGLEENHETISKSKQEEILEDSGINQNDVMARELDGLLDRERIEEEVEFDFEPSQSKMNEIEDNVKGRRTFDDGVLPRRRNDFMKDTESSGRKKRVVAYGLKGLFKSSKRSITKAGESTEESGNRSKTTFGSRRRHSADFDSNDIESRHRHPEAGLKGYMSPTYSSMRHMNSPSSKSIQQSRPKTPPSASKLPSSTKSFMLSPLSSIKELKGNRQTQDAIKEKVSLPDVTRSLDEARRKLGKSFMVPTASYTIKELETQMLAARRAIEKEEEAERIIVNSKTDTRGRNVLPLLNMGSVTGLYSPPKLRSSYKNKALFIAESTPKGRMEWTSKGWVSIDEEDVDDVAKTPLNHTPQSVFSPRSYGSLSSQCTIQSFISPNKAGIVGCLSKFDPYLHKLTGPCELCVFRLSDEEKAELDSEGRHYMVQFTTGGCPDCIEFPTSFEKSPVRLCPKCFSVSHRCDYPINTRMRKAANDTARVGYSFANVNHQK